MTSIKMILFMALWLLASPILPKAAAGAAHTPAAGPEAADLLSEASALFRQANAIAPDQPEEARKLYDKALRRYEKLVEVGIRNGKLYYNIGNSYFRLNDLGRAILNYRRAELFRPDDANLRQNLDYALAKRLDRIKPAEEERVRETLFFFHYDLPLPMRTAIFTGAFTLFWLLAAVRLFSRRSTNWALALTLLVALLMGGSLLAGYLNPPLPRGVILAREVVARKGDGLNFQTSFTEPLHAGTEFQLVEDRGEWRHIELADHRRCWIKSSATGLI